MTTVMSRNQRDAEARKRHRERKIAQVQRERDIAELREHMILPRKLYNQPIIKLPDYSGSAFEDPAKFKVVFRPPFDDYFIYGGLLASNACIRIRYMNTYLLCVLDIVDADDFGQPCVKIDFEVLDDGTMPITNIELVGLENYFDEYEAQAIGGAIGVTFIRSLYDMQLTNVELVDQLPSPRLSEIHEREFGRPLTTYKVLKVNTSHMQYRGRDQETGLQDFDPRRMHVVRGHHAEYGTNGRGLHFGKHQRKIWIPAHVRGNEELGIVVKDYEVVNKE